MSCGTSGSGESKKTRSPSAEIPRSIDHPMMSVRRSSDSYVSLARSDRHRRVTRRRDARGRAGHTPERVRRDVVAVDLFKAAAVERADRSRRGHEHEHRPIARHLRFETYSIGSLPARSPCPGQLHDRGDAAARRAGGPQIELRRRAPGFGAHKRERRPVGVGGKDLPDDTRQIRQRPVSTSKSYVFGLASRRSFSARQLIHALKERLRTIRRSEHIGPHRAMGLGRDGWASAAHRRAPSRQPPCPRSRVSWETSSVTFAPFSRTYSSGGSVAQSLCPVVRSVHTTRGRG